MIDQPMQDFFCEILKRDKYYSLLKNSSVDFYISEAVKQGAQLASKYYECELTAELSKRNIKLIFSDVDTSYYGLVIYGRTIKTCKGISVELYTKALNEKYIRLIDEKKPVDEDLLNSVHLAHEFYHALAYCGDAGPVYHPMKKKEIFFRRTKRIQALEEIAAYAFAYYYCDSLYRTQSPLRQDDPHIPVWYFCE